MENVTYPRRRMAELLELTEDALTHEETAGALVEYGGPKEQYELRFLSAYRRVLGKRPEPLPPRRQLFLNFKGGTGKTSLSVSYAHRLAELGHRVLLVDLDSQAHATQCLGYDGEQLEYTLYDVLINKLPIKQVRIETPLAELHLIPSNLRMATIDLALMPLANREYRLHKALKQVASEYEVVVLDAPPAFGLLNLAAIVSSQDMFIPVLPDFLSFHGLKLLFETIDDVEEDLEHHLDRIFIVLNQYNPTTNIARAAREALEQHYADQLLPEVVRQCTKFAQASSEGLPIFAFDPRSKGAADVQMLIDSTLLRSAPQDEQGAE